MTTACCFPYQTMGRVLTKAVCKKQPAHITQRKITIPSILDLVYIFASCFVNTHNHLLDALLSKKYEEASRKGVMVYFDLPDLRDMPMGQTDLVIVLSNLLNNAIEAAAQADPPEVYVRMRKSEDEVVLSVRNRVKKDLNLVDGQLPRISQKGAGHGFGLWNVRDVLKKYGGEYTISCRECWFRFTCTIPLRKL